MLSGLSLSTLARSTSYTRRIHTPVCTSPYIAFHTQDNMFRVCGKRCSSTAIRPWSMCSKSFPMAASFIACCNILVMPGQHGHCFFLFTLVLFRFALREMQERAEIRMPKPWEEWERYAAGWPSDVFDDGTRSVAIERSPEHPQVIPLFFPPVVSHCFVCRTLRRRRSCSSLRGFCLVLFPRHCSTDICFGKTHKATSEV